MVYSLILKTKRILSSRRHFCLLLLIALSSAVSCPRPGGAPAVDILITNARIVDGTGNPWYRGSVAVAGDRIQAVGPGIETAARRTIDAGDLVVAPGFIDIHNHCDRGLFNNPEAENFLRQGATTLIGGPDGASAVDMGAFLADLDTLPLAVNAAFTVGQGSVRKEVMGLADRAPTEGELEAMKKLVARAMEKGAIGISTGLKYVPGAYSSTEEVIELSKVAASYGGFYTSHLREEGPGLIEAVQEAIRIAQEAAVPVNLTHHKAVGKLMWGRSAETLKMLEQARARGLDITCDQYPYTATSTGLAVLFPPWSLAGGRDSLLARLDDPELRAKIAEKVIYALEYDRGGDDPINVAIASCKFDPSLEGKNLRQILEERNIEPTLAHAVELVFELQRNGGVSCIYHCLNEEDVERIMRHTCTMHASDGTVLPFGEGVPHPRSYGTFPRILGEYVRKRKILTLEEAVRKMTSLPAQRAGLLHRGVIRPGCFADLVIFNPERVIDRATFLDPHQYPEGIETVILNGEVVFEDGHLTDNRPGRVLRAERYKF